MLTRVVGKISQTRTIVRVFLPLQKDAQTGRIPIIGMSAYAMDSEREKAIASGCDEFDAKPIEFEALVATIRRLVANPQ
jgi:CheY-like chemotaxis protein